MSVRGSPRITHPEAIDSEDFALSSRFAFHNRGALCAFESQRPGGDGSGGSTRVQGLSIAGGALCIFEGLAACCVINSCGGQRKSLLRPREPFRRFRSRGRC